MLQLLAIFESIASLLSSGFESPCMKQSVSAPLAESPSSELLVLSVLLGLSSVPVGLISACFLSVLCGSSFFSFSPTDTSDHKSIYIRGVCLRLLTIRGRWFPFFCTCAVGVAGLAFYLHRRSQGNILIHVRLKPSLYQLLKLVVISIAVKSEKTYFA